MTVDIRALRASLTPEQKLYAQAIIFWIAEFGATSLFSKMQREEEKKAKKKQIKEKRTTASGERSKYRVCMGHAYEIAGRSVTEQWTAYQKNFARHNFEIFLSRGSLNAKEAKEVHVYLRELFGTMSDGKLKLRDTNSALRSVRNGGLYFLSRPIWPKVTNEMRHNPPQRPKSERMITTASGKKFDTWTYTG